MTSSSYADLAEARKINRLWKRQAAGSKNGVITLRYEIRYVLLEWTEGGDSILTLDCVRNFSVKDFLEGTEKAEEHLVEWRKGRKPWPAYRAKIIHVASMLHANFSYVVTYCIQWFCSHLKKCKMD